MVKKNLNQFKFLLVTVKNVEKFEGGGVNTYASYDITNYYS